MIKKLLFITPVFLLSAAAMQVDSNSAPASNTGAPGENNCTTSSCHDTYAVNSGTGSTAINFENGITSYVPGKTYSISVEVSQASLMRFGFQMVALKNSDNANTGIFSPADVSKNQVTKGFGNLSNRKYITYTYESTLAQIPGKGSWAFNWTAPSTNEGAITFYLAGLAADNNGNDYGDYCYTKSLSISPASVIPADFNLNVFPNPGNDVLTINYSLTQAADIKIQLTNSLGQNMQELELGLQNPGDYALPFSLIKEYGKGVYFIRFIRDEKVIVKKIILTK